MLKRLNRISALHACSLLHPFPFFLAFSEESHCGAKAGPELLHIPDLAHYCISETFLDSLISKTFLFRVGEAVIDSSVLTLYLCIWVCQTLFYFGSLRGYGRVNSYGIVS